MGGCASPRELPDKACTIDNSPPRCNVIKFFLLRELHPARSGGGCRTLIRNPSIREIGRERRRMGEYPHLLEHRISFVIEFVLDYWPPCPAGNAAFPPRSPSTPIHHRVSCVMARLSLLIGFIYM